MELDLFLSLSFISGNQLYRTYGNAFIFFISTETAFLNHRREPPPGTGG